MKSPIKVYLGCGHNFHAHCINSLAKEASNLGDDSKNKSSANSATTPAS